MDYILGVIILALLGYLAYRESLYSKSIKDLTLKIMAKNVSDYTFLINRDLEEEKNLEKVLEENPVSSSDLIDLADADISDEELIKALRK